MGALQTDAGGQLKRAARASSKLALLLLLAFSQVRPGWTFQTQCIRYPSLHCPGASGSSIRHLHKRHHQQPESWQNRQPPQPPQQQQQQQEQQPQHPAPAPHLCWLHNAGVPRSPPAGRPCSRSSCRSLPRRATHRSTAVKSTSRCDQVGTHISHSSRLRLGSLCRCSTPAATADTQRPQACIGMHV